MNIQYPFERAHSLPVLNKLVLRSAEEVDLVGLIAYEHILYIMYFHGGLLFFLDKTIQFQYTCCNFKNIRML
jgi:hypothetical protein